MTNSNSSSLSRAWLRANCCRCGDTRQDTMNNNLKEETPLREETETLLHRIAFTVWHTALHIESEVRGCCHSSVWFFPHFSHFSSGRANENKGKEDERNEIGSSLPPPPPFPSSRGWPRNWKFVFTGHLRFTRIVATRHDAVYYQTRRPEFTQQLFSARTMEIIYARYLLSFLCRDSQTIVSFRDVLNPWTAMTQS